MFFIVCLPFLYKYSLFFWIALFIIKNIMGKKFIISEDERNRILGLHETAKNNYGTVISEQYAGVAFGGEQNGLKIKKVEATEQTMATGGDDAKVKYKNLIAKVDQFLPFDYQELKTLYNKMKEKPGTYNLIDTMQPFLSKNVQDLLNKVNSKGYQNAINSGWRRYIDLNGRDLDQSTQEGIYAAAINDLLTAQGSLRNKAAELAGLQPTYSPWAKTEIGKKVIDMWAKQSGLVA
jgi:hypothetical protein